jgi:hypothetical protein
MHELKDELSPVPNRKIVELTTAHHPTTLTLHTPCFKIYPHAQFDVNAVQENGDVKVEPRSKRILVGMCRVAGLNSKHRLLLLLPYSHH